MQIIKGTPTKELIEQIVADTNDKAKMEIMQFSGMDDKTLSGVFADVSHLVCQEESLLSCLLITHC